MCVTYYDKRASVFVVDKLEPFECCSQGSFCVRLAVGTCDSGLFQSLHFSGRHALAACATVSIEWGPYLHPVYTLQAVLKVY
ncbi:uncharacterized protein DS421_18g623060 [Arachis hypogaea]|nr:uncharacterized protein DS421_18g623060 [Arachis hypogaea]